MHALVTRVQIDPTRLEDAERVLHQMVVPNTRQNEGFKSGHWVRSADGTRGMAIELYESEAAANAASANAAPPQEAPVTLEGYEVYEVLASA